MLTCPLALERLLAELFGYESEGTLETADGELLARAVAEFFQYGISLAKDRWGGRLARNPWAATETKRHAKRRYFTEEKAVITLLAEKGSTARINYCRMELNQARAKAVLKRLRGNCRHQVVFATIICATKFKYFDAKRQKRQVQRANNCGRSDSSGHMVQCYALNLDSLYGEAEFECEANALC